MRKANEPIFEWINNNTVNCVLEDKEGHIGLGIATCHPDDADMRNIRTGEEIAYRRARISIWRQMRDEIKIALKALKQTYHSMNMSKKFNSNSYENYMLQRQIRHYQFDLDTIKQMIVDESQSLKLYITNKDLFYQQIRTHRNKGINN